MPTYLPTSCPPCRASGSGPPHASSPKSWERNSNPQHTWHPMPASHPSPANPGPPSVAKPHPGAATRHSNVCCSFPHLHPSKVTQPPAPTTTRNEPKANATTKPSSPSPDADQTSYLPCSETAPSMNRGQPNWPQPLDEN